MIVSFGLCSRHVVGHAVAHFGRISKSLHVLRLADDEPHRHESKLRPDLTEGRHDLAQ
ncbi:hypothetical protein ACIHDR_24395 [Nocardia sp. NPDC052278]|uniref:hypothetical protein n=1 Tax=unclassified Nocardia TaxID=2637762 RepID=UPI0036CA5A6E